MGGPIVHECGWVGVDTTIARKDYRFVNTHLEGRFPDPRNPLAPFIQSAQAAELIGVLKASTPPDRALVIVRDFNSPDQDPFIPGPLPLPPPFGDGLPPPTHRSSRPASSTSGSCAPETFRDTPADPRAGYLHYALWRRIWTSVHTFLPGQRIRDGRWR